MPYLAFVLAVALVLTALAALLNAAETAVMLLPVGRVHRLVESERPGARALQALADHRHRLRGVAALVSGLAYCGGALSGWLAVIAAVRSFFDTSSSRVGASLTLNLTAVLGMLLGVFVIHSLIQALPRTLAVVNPERLGLDAAQLALPITQAVYPVTRLLGAPWKWAVTVVGAERSVSPWAVTPEWRGAEPDEDSGREEAEEAMLEAVSDFSETITREVMVPRTDMKALPDTSTISDAIALIRSAGFTRIPIYHETIDDVRGIVYAKDLLGVEGIGESRVLEYARAAYFVPETKPVEELLAEMRSATHIAIVADEYGGTAGLVTLEDLLEEIVGEISDEYDRVEELVAALGDGSYQVDARLPVDDLNEMFGTDIETDVDSVGGLFTEVLGRIPAVGEAIEVEGLSLTVIEMEATRILKLRVEPGRPAGEGGEDA